MIVFFILFCSNSGINSPHDLKLFTSTKRFPAERRTIGGKYWDQIFTGLQLKYVSVFSLKRCNSRHKLYPSYHVYRGNNIIDNWVKGSILIACPARHNQHDDRAGATTSLIVLAVISARLINPIVFLWFLGKMY
jgi:hypothetical protein